MTYSANLRRQHDAILALANELIAAQASLRIPAEAAEAARRLAKLTGVLQLHLAAEDKSLYPRLKASGDAEVAETASRFMDEMGGLARAYGDFDAKWRSEAAILSDPAGFRSQTAEVVAALSTRIARENKELYPLADAAAGNPRQAA